MSAVLSTPRILDTKKSFAEGSAVCSLKYGTKCLEQEASLNVTSLNHPQITPPSVEKSSSTKQVPHAMKVGAAAVEDYQ